MGLSVPTSPGVGAHEGEGAREDVAEDWVVQVQVLCAGVALPPRDDTRHPASTHAARAGFAFAEPVALLVVTCK